MEAKRPTLVTVIGWAAVGLGVLGIIGAVGHVLACRSLLRYVEPGSKEVPLTLMPVGGLRLFEIGVPVQLLVMVFVIVAAVQFLRLRAWARTALEAVVWIGLTVMVASGLFAGWLIVIAPNGSVEPGPSNLVSRVSMAVMISCGCALFAIAGGAVIRLLRSPTVRGAMIGGRRPQAPPAHTSV